MERRNETEEEEVEKELHHENECSFEWDESSQLYYHASSGFYHDPSAGWYYSSRDGFYYKFEDGNYVPLESHQGDQSEVHQCGSTIPDYSVRDEPCLNEDMDFSLFQGGESEASKEETVLDEPCKINRGCIDRDVLENPPPPPPSEWLEDTLIELYLSGYSNEAQNAASDVAMPMETDHMDSENLSVDGAANDDTYELEEGEWIPDDSHDAIDSSGSVFDEDAYRDEENWRAQYGQVVKSDEDSVPAFPVVDLWDWKIVTGTKKGGKGLVSRLVGRLVRRSTKFHPSMPSGGNILKTAPICEAHLDLVRVTSGQVYKLRSPRPGYLASLSTYDSSNPTKDWGFPELSIEKQTLTPPKSSRNSESKTIKSVPIHKDTSLPQEQLSISQMNRSNAYRDRAAERRALHGGFGVGPGQKKSAVGIDSEAPSPVSDCPEEAAAESLNMSFGAGSYARRLLENMGWKEGEALGNSTKGLTEPLRAVGNKGNAGLGWDLTSRKHC
ncbi:hypothetical protein LguiA_028085 [Lonicera macranthoides]